jgi:hypothetical protein
LRKCRGWRDTCVAKWSLARTNDMGLMRNQHRVDHEPSGMTPRELVIHSLVSVAA